MKDKNIKLIIINFTVLLIGIFIGLNIFSPYDANRDGKINTQDYIIIKKYVMKGCGKNG